jgi:putative DNA-invertase from lambdoid prophage Rac
MTMAAITAVPEFERDLIRERTEAGLARALAAGSVLSRKPKLDSEKKAAARAKLAAGASISAVARDMNISRMTVLRAKNEAGA